MRLERDPGNPLPDNKLFLDGNTSGSLGRCVDKSVEILKSWPLRDRRSIEIRRDKLFLEEKEENSDRNIEEKLQKMLSMEADKRLPAISQHESK